MMIIDRKGREEVSDLQPGAAIQPVPVGDVGREATSGC